jgi:2-haloacid dehalogenase
MEAYLVLPPFADAKDALGTLKAAGIRTAILSNGSPSMLTAVVDNAGFARALDAVLSVDAVGVYKPHPRVYQLACDRFATEAGRICFVSANAWDVSGAARFGFRVVWLNRSGGLLDPLPGRPEYEIADLGALPACLGLAG